MIRKILDVAFIEKRAGLFIYHVLLDCGHLKRLALLERPKRGSQTRCLTCEIIKEHVHD